MSSKFLNYCNYDIYVFCSSNRSLLRYLSDFSIKKYIYPSENDLQNFLIFKETLEKKEKERGFVNFIYSLSIYLLVFSFQDLRKQKKSRKILQFSKMRLKSISLLLRLVNIKLTIRMK